jgi:hypothetical protein
MKTVAIAAQAAGAHALRMIERALGLLCFPMAAYVGWAVWRGLRTGRMLWMGSPHFEAVLGAHLVRFWLVAAWNVALLVLMLWVGLQGI